MVDLPPDHAGPGSAAPQAAPGEAAVRASACAGGGLVVDQDEPQCGDGAGVVTSVLEVGERVPHRADQLTGAGSAGQPGHGPSGQLRHHGAPPPGLAEVPSSAEGTVEERHPREVQERAVTLV
jgi:hypothetical protein